MQPNQLDPDAVSMAKAIRQTESGGNFTAQGKSGEYGAYQFTEPTWNSYAKKYGINAPLKSATPEQQNEVAYKQIKEWKDGGYNVGQVASMWNSGKPDAYNDPSYVGVNSHGVKFDVPAYAKSVATAYQSLKSGTQIAQDPNNPSSIPAQPAPQDNQEEGYKPWFKASPQDSGLTAGLKAAGNTIPSAINFGKGVLESINPINTIKNIAAIPGAFKEAVAANQGSIANTLGNTAASLPGEAYKAVVPSGIQKLVKGDTEGASKTFTEDPFGQAAPLVFAAEGGAKLADNISSKSAMSDYVNNIQKNVTERNPIPKPSTKYSGMFDKTVQALAKPITGVAESIGNNVGNTAGRIATSVASHLTGLEPQTIKQVLSDPKLFSKIERDNASRGGLAGEIQSSIENRLKDLKETGKGYEDIRKSNQTLAVPEGLIEQTLAEKGLKIKKGKIVADTNSITRNSADINAIQKFYNDWGNKKTLTPNEYLNMRSDLGELSKFDKLTGMGKTRASETIGQSLYEKSNRTIRDTQMEHLKALDDSYAPERTFLEQVRKDYFNSDGTFKDGAPSKIANAGNKAELLKRLESIMPGVTKRIQILKAVEDIQRASGIKVGSYGRLVAGGLGFASGGIGGALLAEIMTSPELAVPILRKAGYIGSKATPIINALKAIGGDIGKSDKIKGLLYSKQNSY